ncbi:CHASE sensor domain-containing protein [Desulfonema magnum]|uniref:histidine kinase n=1 Tax=Desulfonema magnum TaxID=45655 RepID=A0A975BIH0_9BACT|nr:CHASE sensor domain-containing protein [Desulfonema magnum]QTA86056.1 Periplasmic sensor domain-containing protein [Desulfonema magnum]
MRILKNLSFQRKLILIIMLTSGVTLLLASVAFVVKDVVLYRHSLVYSLSSMTQVIGMNSQGTLVFNDQYTAEKNLTALRTMPYVFSACIYDREGEVFATYFRDDVAPDISPPEYQESGHYFKNFEHKEYLFLFEPIRLEDETIGTVFIQYDLGEMLFKMKEAGVIFVVIMLVAMFVAFMLSNMLQRVISEPILKLIETAKIISKEKDYSVRAECNCYRDEIGILVNGFNEMLAEIQSQERELRQHRENELKQHQEYLHR